MITRRAVFSAALLCAPPLGALAQSQAKTPVIGIIRPEPLPSPSYDAFRQGLRDLGYVEEQTIVLEPRWPKKRQFEDYLGIAKEFVRREVDIIVTGHTLSTLAAQHATQTIPIVFGATTLPSPARQIAASPLQRTRGMAAVTPLRRSSPSPARGSGRAAEHGVDPILG